jgi:Uri superfamily endonuclease
VTPPPVPGAYALIITLGHASGELVPGRYLYAGSAWGPGGIAARVRRHARAGKSIHWHVDRLTTAGRVGGVIAVPGGRECAIVAAVAPLPGVSVPAPGFGSSDCRACAAHLLRLPDDLAPATIARILDTDLLAPAASPVS